MTEKHLRIDYIEYDGLDEMTPEDRALVEAAAAARDGSYSPYSKFSVGAALRLVDGRVVLGANQENAAYPAGLCAERTAMFAASANHPDVAFDTLAIVGGHHGETCAYPVSPCGSCRQVMAEYQKKFRRPLQVILAGEKRIRKFSCVDALLPFIFDSLDAE